MKQILLLSILLNSAAFFGQTNKNYKFKDYDSLVVQTLDDNRYELDFNSGKRLDTIIITGQATMNGKDAEELNERMSRKESYGQSQASTPAYDLKIMYYKEGKVKETVEVCLWTNNLFATFPLIVQRQGVCLCEGNGGYCCSAGGISMRFKKYLLDVLQKYNLPADREGILNFGQ